MARSWTCGRCRVRTSFSPGADEPVKPAAWVRVDGEWRCLACRRMEVLDVAAATGASGAATTRRRALTEFELLRDPSSSDGVIAKRVKCNSASVASIRADLRAAERLRRTE
jgi:hypothetical protein